MFRNFIKVAQIDIFHITGTKFNKLKAKSFRRFSPKVLIIHDWQCSQSKWNICLVWQESRTLFWGIWINEITHLLQAKCSSLCLTVQLDEWYFTTIFKILHDKRNLKARSSSFGHIESAICQLMVKTNWRLFLWWFRTYENQCGELIS